MEWPRSVKCSFCFSPVAARRTCEPHFVFSLRTNHPWFNVSHNNQQPRTKNQQPTTNNQQPTTNNQQPTTNNQQPTTNNQQPTTNNNYCKLLQTTTNYHKLPQTTTNYHNYHNYYRNRNRNRNHNPQSQSQLHLKGDRFSSVVQFAGPSGRHERTRCWRLRPDAAESASSGRGTVMCG